MKMSTMVKCEQIGIMIFKTLPREIWTEILLMLSAEDIINVCQTDKHMFEVCNDQLW